jgi:hypothetical protein
MKKTKKYVLYVFFSLLVILLLITLVILYLKNQPTKVTIQCQDYDQNYYRCLVESPLPLSSELGISVVNMCLKDENGTSNIWNCTDYVWSHGNCNFINSHLVNTQVEKGVISEAYCKSL